LAIALEIDDEQRVAAVARRAREDGLLVSAEEGSLGLWPALDIPRETAEEGLDILGRCLAQIGAKGRKRDGAGSTN
jgi:4-aminobutyrate aminotransferase-like enzyme